MTRIGINTLVYVANLQAGIPQSQILPRIADLGLSLAEVRREYISKPQEMDAIRNAAEEYNLTLFYSVPDVITSDGHVNPLFDQYLTEAEHMGVSNVKFNQGDIKDVSADILHSLEATAAAKSVTLTIENDQTPQNGTLECTTASLENIEKYGSSIGYTFDLGNWYWRNTNPVEAFEKLQKYISVFHLKNVNRATNIEELSTTMLADGVIPWQTLLNQLDSSVPVFLEFPIPSEFVSEQLALVQSALN